jgi:hypothetical protein
MAAQSYLIQTIVWTFKTLVTFTPFFPLDILAPKPPSRILSKVVRISLPVTQVGKRTGKNKEKRSPILLLAKAKKITVKLTSVIT